jgi:hypothetical protein
MSLCETYVNLLVVMIIKGEIRSGQKAIYMVY